MKKICVTGGAGFIASHLTEHLHREYPQAEIVVIDKMGYAARAAYLADVLKSGKVRLVEGSICDTPLMMQVLKGADLVVHAAAESHVDNSYKDLRPFLEDNIHGTISLLDAAVRNNVGLFFHISTDEVYGESSDRDFTDDEKLCPTNPYAASKASAEMFVQCYASSYGLKTRISRANNIYGTRQYPEKLIPKLICDAARGKTFHVHGRGTSVRSFLHVSDFCRAASVIIERGEDGGVYNVPALHEYSVMEVVDLVCDSMGIRREDLIRFGPDRPHNDCRYGVVGDKLLALGWKPERRLSDDIAEIVDWYRSHLDLYYETEAETAARVATPRMARFGNLVDFVTSPLRTDAGVQSEPAAPGVKPAKVS